MKDQLIKYVDLLFAGAPEAFEIKQEILQNTLERYDDLISQGKAPQAAYQLAISGIGDINEILGSVSDRSAAPQAFPQASSPAAAETPAWKKLMRAIGVCIYIMCPIPLFVLSEMHMATIGLCGTLTLVAVATALMVISGGKGSSQAHNHSEKEQNPNAELRKSIRSLITIIGLGLYFVISFSTNAWYITWIIFPIIGAVQGLINACMDLKEASKNEI